MLRDTGWAVADSSPAASFVVIPRPAPITVGMMREFMHAMRGLVGEFNAFWTIEDRDGHADDVHAVVAFWGDRPDRDEFIEVIADHSVAVRRYQLVANHHLFEDYLFLRAQVVLFDGDARAKAVAMRHKQLNEGRVGRTVGRFWRDLDGNSIATMKEARRQAVRRRLPRKPAVLPRPEPPRVISDEELDNLLSWIT